MRRMRTLLFLAIAIGAGGCSQMSKSIKDDIAAATTTAASSAPSPVVATVNDAAITRSLFEVYQRERNQNRTGDVNARNPELVLDEIINLELAAQDGVRLGLDKSPEAQVRIEQQRRAVIANMALQEHLRDHPVTDEELDDFYKERAANLGSEYKARHILVANRDIAKKLIRELDKGADFSELAKQHSADASAANGGELGWFKAQQVLEPFAVAVAKLEKGAYTSKPVQTRFGWHVIMLDDKREVTLPPLNEIRKQVRKALQNQRLQDYVKELRAKARIDINRANLPITPEAQAAADREAAEQQIREELQPE